MTALKEVEQKAVVLGKLLQEGIVIAEETKKLLSKLQALLWFQLGTNCTEILNRYIG